MYGLVRPNPKGGACETLYIKIGGIGNGSVLLLEKPYQREDIIASHIKVGLGRNNPYIGSLEARV